MTDHQELLERLRRELRPTYNATEVALILEKDPRTVRRACDRGQIPSFRRGQQRLILGETLLKLLTGEPVA